MEERDYRRIAGAGGIVFGVLLVVAFAIGGKPPAFDASTAKVVKHVSDKRNALQVGGLLVIVAIAFFAFFLGALAHRNRGAEGRAGGRLTTTAFAGGIFAAAMAAVGAAAVQAAAAHVGSLSPGVTQGLWDVQAYAFNMALLGMGILLIAVCSLSTRYGSIPSWLGWAGGAIGALDIVTAAVGSIDDTGPFSVYDGVIGFIAFLGFIVWTVVVSGVLVADPAK